VAQQQLAVKKGDDSHDSLTPGPDDGPDDKPDTEEKKPDPPRPLRRYHGTVRLDPTRVGRDAGRIAEEVIAHLAGQPGAEVSVVLEIHVRLPEGATEHTVRTVTENSRTLKFETFAFERD
jgi:hypothetical protein